MIAESYTSHEVKGCVEEEKREMGKRSKREMEFDWKIEMRLRERIEVRKVENHDTILAD